MRGTATAVREAAREPWGEDGSDEPSSPGAARRLACYAATVHVNRGEGGEVLDVEWRREWDE